MVNIFNLHKVYNDVFKDIYKNVFKVRDRFIKRYNINEHSSKYSIHRMTVLNVISHL